MLTASPVSADWELTYLTMGPDGARDALRKALSMGGDAAFQVRDDALHGSDAFATSLVLAAAIQRIGFDLVLTGVASTDAGMGVVPALLAERLAVPQLTFAIVSVTDRNGEARYPSFKGIMAAKKKPVDTLSLADLGIDPGLVGLAAARSTVLSAARRPARTVGQLVKDDGDGGKLLAGFMAANRFI